MSTGQTMAAYVAAIAVGALAGAAVPMALPGLQRRSGLLLSFSAGVMLGAAFFHMLPEAIHEGGFGSLTWALGGFSFLFLLERYLLVHFCKGPACKGAGAGHGEEAATCEAGHAHLPHELPTGTMGLAAFVGLSIHTIADGFALGTAMEIGVGTSVFLAILFHKIPSSFSLSSILLHERYRARRALFFTALQISMLPVGALLYFFLQKQLDHEALGSRALGFSAGTFLHVAVADLLPDLHRRRDQRGPLVLALLAGVALMAALGWFGPAHSH